MLRSLRFDLKHALVGLRRSPGFAAAAVVALALGIGCNVVIFSAVNAVLLNPVPFRALHDPDRLVMLWERNPAMAVFFAERMPARLRNYRAWKEQARSFDDMAAWISSNVTLTGNEDRRGLKPERVESGLASSNFFPMLGVRLQAGRDFTAEEMQPGKGQVAIITDELYRSRFGGDPAILQRYLTADGKQYRIIGVLATGFQLPAFWEGFDQKNPKIWFPLDVHPPGEQDEAFNCLVFARLRPGVDITAARSEMKVIENRLKTAYPDRNTGFGINLFSLAQENTGPDLRQALLVLQVAVGFVLLIACANTGNLLLTRALEREKEMAIRTALGAGRWRIVQQAFAESLVLSTAAAAVGLLIAYWALNVFMKFAPEDVHGLHDVHMDGTVLAFAAGLSTLTAVLFSVIPAIHAWNGNISEVLGRTSRNASRSSHRVRNTLAAIEVALSLVLLVGAGLMIRTLNSLMNTDLGFRPENLLVMRVELPEDKYKDPAAAASFNTRLLENVRQLPSIRNAALTTALPMKTVSQGSFEFVGVPNKPGSAPVSNWARCSDGYFETLGLRVMRGRTFGQRDADVAVVNEAFERSFFRNGDAIGKAFTFINEAGKMTNYRIIGVVANERQMGPDNEQSPEFYLPGSQLRSIILFARTAGDPLAAAPAVKQQVWNIEKDQPISDVVTAETMLRNWTSPRRFNMIVLLSFAGIAMALAAVGLYSVLAYSVTLRTREIGIRVALGAEPAAISRLVLRQGFQMAAVGIAVGVAGALMLTRFMQSLIFGVSSSDPLTIVAVSVLLTIISLLASYVPAHRAAKVNPIEALRAE